VNLKIKLITLFTLLLLGQQAKAAENIFLYKGTFSRVIKVDDLINFQKTKVPNDQLKRLLYITNQNEDALFKALSYEIEIPITISSRLMNSKIGEVFLKRISKIIHPNKISKKEIGIKAIRSAIILSSFKNNQKINLIQFFEAYPNKNIAINLNGLTKALEKAESLTDLIEFYSNSPLKKIKDGRSNT
tara:strand:+ start:199 stop:762 length:564 start_codon:yes stop_codon:yes gene_type:complete